MNTIAVEEKGKIAIGSETGEIRLYNEIGNRASNKYSLKGGPVLHL